MAESVPSHFDWELVDMLQRRAVAGSRITLASQANQGDLLVLLMATKGQTSATLENVDISFCSTEFRQASLLNTPVSS